ncbi:DUF6286 domain-containing protein [Brevibacterium atlanticum]|uniref:DUF6286 domain-containing protein n=1 Tax=Brevibacterium atlanticum TaxID=2697563 RepID=UPI00141F3B85|nr:DUF6286 domain-containing protein [Brevibacterium atlanticum]
MSTRLLRRRPARIGSAVVIAIILLLVAVALGWAGIAAMVTSGSSAGAATAPLTDSGAGLDSLDHVHWGSAAVIAVGAVLAVLGLIAVILGISPGARRITSVQAATPDHIGDLEVAVPTSALSHLAASAADGVDGVEGVKAASNATSTIVTFSTPIRDSDPIRDEVEAIVRERFDSISFDRTPKVKVQARRSKS